MEKDDDFFDIFPDEKKKQEKMQDIELDYSKSVETEQVQVSDKELDHYIKKRQRINKRVILFELIAFCGSLITLILWTSLHTTPWAFIGLASCLIGGALGFANWKFIDRAIDGYELGNHLLKQIHTFILKLNFRMTVIAPRDKMPLIMMTDDNKSIIYGLIAGELFVIILGIMEIIRALERLLYAVNGTGVFEELHISSLFILVGVIIAPILQLVTRLVLLMQLITSPTEIV